VSRGSTIAEYTGITISSAIPNMATGFGGLWPAKFFVISVEKSCNITLFLLLKKKMGDPMILTN